MTTRRNILRAAGALAASAALPAYALNAAAPQLEFPALVSWSVNSIPIGANVLLTFTNHGGLVSILCNGVVVGEAASNPNTPKRVRMLGDRMEIYEDTDDSRSSEGYIFSSDKWNEISWSVGRTGEVPVAPPPTNPAMFSLASWDGSP